MPRSRARARSSAPTLESSRVVGFPPLMADWKKTNFGELEDRSPPDVAMQWRFARKAPARPSSA